MSRHAEPHVTCSLPCGQPLKFFTGQALRQAFPTRFVFREFLLTLSWESWIFSSGTFAAVRRGRDAAERLRARALMQHLSAPPEEQLAACLGQRRLFRTGCATDPDRTFHFFHPACVFTLKLTRGNYESSETSHYSHRRLLLTG